MSKAIQKIIIVSVFKVRRRGVRIANERRRANTTHLDGNEEK